MEKKWGITSFFDRGPHAGFNDGERYGYWV